MKDTINLLPKRGLEEPKIQEKVKRRFLIAGSIFFLVLVLWLIPFILFLRLNTEHNAQLAQIEEKEKSIQTLQKEETTYRNIFNKVKGAQVILEKEHAFLEKLTSVKTLVNSSLAIKGIVIDTTSAKLTVTTADTASILTYLDALEAEGEKKNIFKNLIVSSVALSKTSGYEVKIEGAL